MAHPTAHKTEPTDIPDDPRERSVWIQRRDAAHRPKPKPLQQPEPSLTAGNPQENRNEDR
jgi:hypothetical protein